MELISAYRMPSAALILYQVLEEREPQQCISHKSMPSMEEHLKFFMSRPYLFWYLVVVDDVVVGSIYLSKQREIGIWILKDYQGFGHGPAAVTMLMAAHPGKFLANINPANPRSVEMFSSMGFAHIQNTYAHG